MKQQSTKHFSLNPFQATCLGYSSRYFFIVLLALLIAMSGWAAPTDKTKTDLHPAPSGTVTTNPSSLFFTAVESNVSVAQPVDIVISGVSAGSIVNVSAPNFYTVFNSAGVPVKNVTGTGNGLLRVFVRFEGSSNPGSFTGQLTISGNEIPTKIVSLVTANASNPLVFPTALNFTTLEFRASAAQEIMFTVAEVSPTAITNIEIFGQFTLSTTATGTAFRSASFTGPFSVKLFVTALGDDVGTQLGEITVSSLETSSKFIPLKNTILPTPTPTVTPGSLNGFTAVQGVSPSAIQSFDLSVTGLVPGNATVNVTAPKGYSISLSNNPASFLNAFFIAAVNGKITGKIFTRLNSTNPVGTVKGDITIAGAQVNTQVVQLTGTVTPKPLPTLTVDKTNLTGFNTVTNKASTTQFYQLQASNLDAGINATVKAPAGYDVSLSNTATSVFGSQLTIVSAAGTINSTVFVRLKSQSVTGTITGTIQNLVAGLSKSITVNGTVVPPPALTVNPMNITGFTTVKNQASAAKTYTVTAVNLTAGLNVVITAPANYEVRLQGTGPFAATLTLTQNITAGINRVVEVRLKATATIGSITGTLQNNLAGLIKNVTLTGTINSPSLSTSASSLAFTAIKNQASAAKTYKVVAANLATGNTAVLTASAAYELSTSGTGVFTGSITLQQNVVNGINTDVFVRLKASAVTGTVTGSIQHTVAGLTKITTLSATVAAPLLSVNPVSLSGFTTIKNQTSATKSYTLAASNLVTGLSATVSAPAGYEISISGTNIFSSGITVSQTATGSISKTILVRLKAQTVTGTIAGNITNSIAGIVKTQPVTGLVNNPIPFSGEIINTKEERANLHLNENELAVSIFPNPITDLFTVQLNEMDMQHVQLKIVDLHGRMILIQQISMLKGTQQVKLSLAGQQPGTYFLEVISGAKRSSVKIIKL